MTEKPVITKPKIKGKPPAKRDTAKLAKALKLNLSRRKEGSLKQDK